MTDPRNIAHDKKVLQEKKHHGVDVAASTQHAPQPGKKSHVDHVDPTAVEHAPDSNDAGDKLEPNNTP